MAKIECELAGNFDTILKELDDAVLDRSTTASLEDSSDFTAGGTRCAVRVYERYSWSGGNRVSMNLTLLETDGRIFLSLITSGGSQAMFLKINTIGERAFLDTVREIADKYHRAR